MRDVNGEHPCHLDAGPVPHLFDGGGRQGTGSSVQAQDNVKGSHEGLRLDGEGRAPVMSLLSAERLARP